MTCTGPDYIEQLPDGDFTNPAAWEIVGFGGSITGGTLQFILANVIRAAPLPLIPSIVGRTYHYILDVASVTAFGTQGRALWGNVEFWNKSQGAGIFTGDIVATGTGGLVFQANTAQYTVNSISISEVGTNRFNILDSTCKGWASNGGPI